MKFFRFEKEKLRDLVLQKAIDFEQEFSEKEREALVDSLKYSSSQYLESGIQYFPSYEKASRVEISYYLEKNSDIKSVIKLLKKFHKIVLGWYEIVIDFWFFADSQTKGIQLSYPRFVL